MNISHMLFLTEVYKLVETNDIDGAADLVFDYIDRLLCDGCFDECDEILRNVKVDLIPTTLMRSFLSITNAAKQKLPSRVVLYEIIERKMIDLKGTDRTKKILGTLA